MTIGLIIALIVIALIAIFTAIIIGIHARSKRKRTHYTPNYPQKHKGDIGEGIVADVLGNTIYGQQYVINGLCYKIEYSCEIDHIVINKYGIWVIETKNYNGYIYGKENDDKWIQVLGSDRNELRNPLHQNYGHISTLKKDLHVKNIFHNVVVFLSCGDISNVLANNVCTEFELRKLINTDTGIRLSIEQMEYYYKAILNLKYNYSISKEQHVSNITIENMKIHKGICPDCGGKLEIRTGQYGDYYSCTNYPNCRFRRNIPG